jgi:hypothetical protein
MKSRRRRLRNSGSLVCLYALGTGAVTRHHTFGSDKLKIVKPDKAAL